MASAGPSERQPCLKRERYARRKPGMIECESEWVHCDVSGMNHYEATDKVRKKKLVFDF
jgi:hypothetical protein